MATYYQYDKSGALQSTSTADPIRDQPSGPIDVDHYLQRGDTVGAFLAQRAMIYPGHAFPTAYHGEVPQNDGASDRYEEPYHDQYQVTARHHSEDHYDSYGWEADSQHEQAQMLLGMAAPRQYPDYHNYPDLEKIRHMYSLYNLLPHIHPGRRFRSWDRQTIDIIEEGTGNILYHDFSKKVLALFLGRTTMKRLLVTQFDCQRLVMPRGLSSKSAWNILCSWMRRAALEQYMQDLQSFRVPHNMFSACTLAQTLSFIGLHKDAYRVEMTIQRYHFKRPIFAVELEALWINLGPDNKFTCAAIDVVKIQLQNYVSGASTKYWVYDGIMELLEWYPDLKTAVMGTGSEGQRLPLRSAEQDIPRDALDATTIAKRRGKAKVLRIVVNSKESNEPGEGQDSGEAAEGEKRLAE